MFARRTASSRGSGGARLPPLSGGIKNGRRTAPQRLPAGRQATDAPLATTSDEPFGGGHETDDRGADGARLATRGRSPAFAQRFGGQARFVRHRGASGFAS